MERAPTTARQYRPSFADVCNLDSLFRNKLLMLGVACAILVLMMLMLWVRDRSYESQVRMFIRLGREAVTVDPTAGATGQVLTLSESQQREIQSVLDILQSRGLVESIVDTLGPEQILDFSESGEPQLNETTTSGWGERLAGQVGERLGDGVVQLKAALVPLKLIDPPNPRAKAVKRLEKSIKVEAEDESNVVAFRVRADSPVLAQRVAEVMLDKFLDAHLHAHRTPGSLEFFSQQLERVTQELDGAMVRLMAAKNEAGVASIESEKDVLASRLKNIETAILDAVASYESASARHADMTQSLAQTPERIVLQEVTGVTNTSRDEMRGPLYDVELRRAQLSQLTEDHPLVRLTDEAIRAAKAVYDQEAVSPQVTTARNREYEELSLAQVMEKANMASASARLEELKQQRDEVAAAIRNLNQREIEIMELQRLVDVTDSKYRRYAESLEQAKIDEALQRDQLSSVNVVHPPSFSEHPVDVSSALITAAGLLAAAVCPLGAAFGSEFLRQRLKTSSDIERQLALPVLVTIPASRKQRIPVA